MIRDILFFDECKLLNEKSLRSNLNFDFDGEIQVMWSQWCTCRPLKYFSETWFSYRNTLKAPSWTYFPYWLSQVCGFGLGWVMYTNWKQSLIYMNLRKKKQSSYLSMKSITNYKKYLPFIQVLSVGSILPHSEHVQFWLLTSSDQIIETVEKYIYIYVSLKNQFSYLSNMRIYL